MQNFEKYFTCSSTPEYNFVSQILEECHENPKQKWVFCHPTPFCCSSQLWKKLVPSVLSCKTTTTFLCKIIWWEQLRHVPSYKFVKCRWILWRVLNKNTEKQLFQRKLYTPKYIQQAVLVWGSTAGCNSI